MSNQSVVDFTPCGPLGSGQCLMSIDLGQSICNDTGGVIVQSPVAQCDYFVCGYENIVIKGNMTDGPLTEGAAVCADGTHSNGAIGMRSKPLGLWSILLMALAVLPLAVQGLPTTLHDTHSLVRRNISTSSFERTANVDWSSVEDQLHGKSSGTSTTIGRSRYTLLSHEPNPSPDSIVNSQGLLDSRQIEGIPPYDTVYQENVDRTGTWNDCPQVQSYCIRSGLSSAGGSVTFSTSYSKSFSISFGLDAGGASNFKGVINGNAGLSLGFTWQTSISWSGSDSCNFNQNVGVAQLFWEPIMGYAETASRTCQVSPIYGELYCTDWDFGYVDYPLESGDMPARIAGCSAEEHNVHCQDAIGTQKCD